MQSVLKLRKMRYKVKDENDTTNLMHEITDISFEEDTSISDSEQAIVYYVAGYIARSLRKPIKCNACCFLLSPGESIQISFEDGSISKKEIGGLLKPSDILYTTCVHASQLFDVLQKNGLLTSLNKPRNVFSKVFKLKLLEKDHTSCIPSDSCQAGHCFETFVEKIAIKMFNIMSKNVASEVNDVIHTQRKRNKGCNSKRDLTTMKIRKLTSD